MLAKSRSRYTAPAKASSIRRISGTPRTSSHTAGARPSRNVTPRTELVFRHLASQPAARAGRVTRHSRHARHSRHGGAGAERAGTERRSPRPEAGCETGAATVGRWGEARGLRGCTVLKYVTATRPRSPPLDSGTRLDRVRGVVRLGQCMELGRCGTGG